MIFTLNKESQEPVINWTMEIDDEGDLEIWANDTILLWVDHRTGELYRTEGGKDSIPGFPLDDNGQIIIA